MSAFAELLQRHCHQAYTGGMKRLDTQSGGHKK